MPQNFGTGAIKDRPDNRDYLWSEIGFGAAPFNWATPYNVQTVLQGVLGNPSFSIPIKNQNGSGSCGGQAWSYLSASLEGLSTKTYEERSARFIYSQTYVQGGGSDGRSNSNIYVNQGSARESVFTSYDNGQPPSEAFMERNSDITSAVRADAKLDRALSYVSGSTDIETVAQMLQTNNGVILGIYGSNNGTWNSAVPTPPTTNDWAHWICCHSAEIINGKRVIGFTNSWGTAAGNGGWQYLSEDYFAANKVWASWTMVYNPNSVTTFKHTFTSPILYGQSGSEVVALQTALQIDGEFPLTVPTTGYYGDVTRAAVLKFQEKYSVALMAELLTLDGRRVGSATTNQLNKLFA